VTLSGQELCKWLNVIKHLIPSLLTRFYHINWCTTLCLLRLLFVLLHVFYFMFLTNSVSLHVEGRWDYAKMQLWLPGKHFNSTSGSRSIRKRWICDQTSLDWSVSPDVKVDVIIVHLSRPTTWINSTHNFIKTKRRLIQEQSSNSFLFADA